MALRESALCNGKIIGIETIYTVINGRQINIPEKLDALRKKSNDKELFCPCGCGTNLILVAGDRNLREQHFRENSGTGKYECTMPTEGMISVNSKIILKCWLDDKLKTEDLETRVPINTVEESKRKPEFTFLSRTNKFAIRYWKNRSNIIEDRLDVIADNLSDIKVLYIVDKSNGGTNGQYPEALMKLQEKQGYCLLLEIADKDYTKATISAVFYAKDIEGLWKEIEIASDKLSMVEIENNQLLFKRVPLDFLLLKTKSQFEYALNEEKKKREKKRIAWEKQQEEERKRLEKQKEEEERQCKEAEEKKRLEAERLEEEKQKIAENFKKNLENNFEQQETIIYDIDGERWLRCEFCGKIAPIREFPSYGGIGKINLGTCKECQNNNPKVREKLEQDIKNKAQNKINTKKNNRSNIIEDCPKCGGKLVKREGVYGEFYGCSSFPRCKYTEKIYNS